MERNILEMKEVLKKNELAVTDLVMLSHGV